MDGADYGRSVSFNSFRRDLDEYRETAAGFQRYLQFGFDLQAVAGGGMGAALMTGIKRGLFSNEAGMGSVPNAAATASASHPVKQGLIQALAFLLILTGMLGFSFYRAVV